MRRPTSTGRADLLARALDVVSPEPYATCFRGISRIGVGEYLIVTADGESARRHWNPMPEPLRLRRAEDYADALRAELDRAVRVRLPATGDVAAHLSAGLDSGSVAATAARLLVPEDRRVIAFTAVPRATTEARGRRDILPDEGPLAAATAALHSNMEHVRVGTDGRSPTDALAWAFDLYDMPILNPCNQVWRDAICDLARDRGLSVLLTGQAGNFTLSYKAPRPLRERIAARGFPGLVDEVRSLAWRIGTSGVRDVTRAILKRGRGLGHAHVDGFVAPARREELAAAADTPMTRRSHSTRDERLAGLRRIDAAHYAKGALARWRIDERDPTADRRFVEFCLSVPDEQFRLGGRPASLARRAMSDRLAPETLREGARGLQAADWHAGFSDPRRQLGAMVDRLAECSETARLLDIPRIRQAIDRWPAQGWHDAEVTHVYRNGLLRALSNGDFLRRAVAMRARRQRSGQDRPVPSQGR